MKKSILFWSLAFLSAGFGLAASPSLAQTKIDLNTQVKGVLPPANGGLAPADKTKLDGIATGATANSTDAQLRDRATHTGTQAIAATSGLQVALDAKVDDSQISVFGLTLVDDIDAGTARTTLGLGSAATSATTAFEASGAVATHAAAGDPHPVYLTATEGNAAYAAIGHVGSGGTAHSNVVAGGAAGFLSGTDKTKLDAISGTNTGDQTITLSGDASGSGTGAITATLATVNAAPQTDQLRKITVSGKGLVTASSAVVAGDIPTLNQNTTGSAATLTTGRTISATGDAAGTSAAFNGSANATVPLTLATVNSNIGSFGSASLVPVVTVNAKGLVTAVSTVAVSAGGGVADGDKGDITVTATGATWTIDAGVVTLAKQADVSSGTVFYRKTAAAGAPEVQTLATLKTDLGLTGTNTGDQTIALTGDVTGSGSGSFAATIGANTVGNAKLAQVATGTIKGRVTAATGNVEDLTAAQAKSVLAISASDVSGLSAVATSGSAASLSGTLGTAQLPALTGGDVTSSAGSSTLTIGNGAVTTAKMGGDVTTAGKALLDDADAAAQRTTLGLAAVASSGSAANLTGNLAVAQLGSGTGASGSTYWRGDGIWATPSGGSDPWAWSKLASDVSNSTAILTSVTGLSFTGAANTTYIVEVIGTFQSAAITTGIALALDIPSGSVSGQNIHPSSATTLTGTEQITDAATTGATTGVRAAATNVPIISTFIVAIGATGGTVQLQFRTEVATSAVTMKAAITAMGVRAI